MMCLVLCAILSQINANFFPGYRHACNEIGKERGWAPVTRKDFDAQRGPDGAHLIGDPDEVIEKIKHQVKYSMVCPALRS